MAKVKDRPLECHGCGKKLKEEEAVGNVDGQWHEDCLEDHLIDAAAGQQKEEARARRKLGKRLLEPIPPTSEKKVVQRSKR